MEKLDLGDLNEEALSKNIQTILKPLGEGEFSFPYYSNGKLTSFFIKKKILKRAIPLKKQDDTKRRIIWKKIKRSYDFLDKEKRSQYHIKYFSQPFKK